eukprot:CAMPEP_0119536978 /NCGR_PEP_ID=MMETSP1344-20130328/49747_1 /TAXON_ID=236787 /ORGANISM="Florenciella parvula, Strain CCMP2471" /LENGTH=64 /DNA_ID=CAMNT_0007579303 /DNA_START=110 /DNA_END=300 /DNA_ORIENTATION=-
MKVIGGGGGNASGSSNFAARRRQRLVTSAARDGFCLPRTDLAEPPNRSVWAATEPAPDMAEDAP